MRTPHPTDTSDIWASAPPSPLEKPIGADFPPRSDDIPGSVFLISSAGDVLKLPIPSESPVDPLNWSWPRRIGALLTIILTSSITLFEVKMSALLMVPFQLDFASEVCRRCHGRLIYGGINPSTTDYINTFASTTNAFGVPVGVALSTALGRRPVLLFATFINVIATAMAGFLPGFGMLFISIGIQGFAAGMSVSMVRFAMHFERLGLLIVFDATFIYERPWATTISWCIISVMANIYFLPLSYITDVATNWRPLYQVWVVPCIISLILTLFLVPESFFIRPSVAFDGRFLVQSASEHIQIYDTIDAISPSGFPEDDSPSERTSLLSRFVDLIRVQRAPGTSWRAAGSTCAQMILCFCNPLVIWVSLLSGVILAVAMFQNETQYRFIIFNLLTTESIVVQLHRVETWFVISGVVSGLLSIPVSGPLITWFVAFCARRSGGTRHAEVYLIGFVLPIVTAAISVGLFASSISNDWPITIQYVIYGVTQMSYILIFSAGTVWLTEAFPLWAAASIAVELLVVVLLGSFLSAKLGSWAEKGNITGPSILQVLLIIILGAVIVPVAFWGKNVRQFIHGRWSLSQKAALRPH
ncbi:major facilitator superfamily domain-containing protein [Plectosphaerella plurivora]|uniref:Major facilitator superfamily domain-containing protein n=1 Tax=Plectosphaerella plurivora TaxID=936078 RepID=A0A9P8VLM0_9PEZI|nr:major facilitator superfamily domain-containing protein [Plectosphaerella plurivora]